MADWASSSWENSYCRKCSARVVTQSTADVWVVGLNHSLPTAAPALTRLASRESNSDLQFCGRLYYCRIAAYSGSPGSPHCLKPSEHKLLTPPPPGPTHPTPTHPTSLKKVISSFRRYRSQNQKTRRGIVLLGKVMILQGVGHQISCLGVCHANDPQKRGVYDARPCA